MGLASVLESQKERFGVSPMAVVVQCFAKVDTLSALLRSLLACRGAEEIDLILWLDKPAQDSAGSKYIQPNLDVQATVDWFIAANATRFRSVTRHSNEYSLGTCKTCQIALDYAFDRHSFVIFLEDDCVLSHDALEWFEAARKLPFFENERVWAITGEACLFVRAGTEMSEKEIATARSAASRAGLGQHFVTAPFVPSTCFATTREKWAEFGQTRGQPLGASDVSQRCLAEGRVTIIPFVARVKDTGMLHERGYSVLHHTALAIADGKNTYVMSDDLDAPVQAASRPYVFSNELADFLAAPDMGDRARFLNGDRALQDELSGIVRADEMARVHMRIAARRRSPARAYLLCQSLHERRPRTTLRIFERYRDLYPKNNWWLIGRFLALAGYGREVIGWMVDLCAKRPDTAEVHACAAMVALEVAEWALAERCARAALVLEPEHATWLWLVSKSIEGSVAAVQARLAQRQSPARAYLLCHAIHERRPLTTLRIFERYRDTTPENSWWLIGRLLALAGHGRELIDWMVDLCVKRPNMAEVLACTAMVAVEISEWEVAERSARAALALEPDHDKWLWLVGEVTRAGRARAAQARSERQQSPVRAYLLCHAIHDRRPLTTLRIFERYRDVYPENAWCLIARRLAAAGHGRELIDWMVALCTKRPETAEVHACTAIVAHEIGNWALAERCARAALALEPEHAVWRCLVSRSADAMASVSQERLYA